MGAARSASWTPGCAIDRRFGHRPRSIHTSPRARDTHVRALLRCSRDQPEPLRHPGVDIGHFKGAAQFLEATHAFATVAVAASTAGAVVLGAGVPTPSASERLAVPMSAPPSPGTFRISSMFLIA